MKNSITALSVFIFGFFILFLIDNANGEENMRPIIGIFGQPSSKHGDYIAASYVKWVESAGGRVVPIPYNATYQHLNFIFNSINGLLFPGGDAEINDKAQYLYDLAIKANNNGVYFPVWGTCLGFEWLLQMTSRDWDILDNGFDAMNISLSLNFIMNPIKKSRMFSKASDRVVSTFATKSITLNNHVSGIKPKNFNENSKLKYFYNVLSTNVDKKNVPFISAIEAKHYPVYGVQFHPEKNAFEWGTYPDGTPYEVINHETEAIEASQYLAYFFVEETRKNTKHSFPSAKIEQRALIYNYHAYMTTWPGFVQSYLFDHDKIQKELLPYIQ